MVANLWVPVLWLNKIPACFSRIANQNVGIDTNRKPKAVAV